MGFLNWGMIWEPRLNLPVSSSCLILRIAQIPIILQRILIQCGHTTREFVALAGAWGDPFDQAGLGTLVPEAS